MDKEIAIKISKRREANSEILQTLKLYLDNNPQIRFSQALVNLNIIEQELDKQGNLITKDPFYEEPIDVLNRIKKV